MRMWVETLTFDPISKLVTWNDGKAVVVVIWNTEVP
jgi:hypothetical protein